MMDKEKFFTGSKDIVQKYFEVSEDRSPSECIAAFMGMMLIAIAQSENPDKGFDDFEKFIHLNLKAMKETLQEMKGIKND